MTIQESLHRGFNLLAVSITSLAGFAFFPEMFVETDMPDKIDDGLLFLIGVSALLWYRRGSNRFTHAVAPIIFMVSALVVKAGGLLIEIDDKEAFGDDIGGLILFVLASALVVTQYKRTKELASTTL
jgi:hypothetical protein